MGNDVVSFTDLTSGITLDLATGNHIGAGLVGDVFINIERYWGSNYNDTMIGTSGNDELHGGNGDDTVYGNDGNDFLRGNHGNDSLYGGNGNDRLLADTGADYMDGGAGIDNAQYTYATAGISVDLSLGRGLGGEALGDTLISIENIDGSAYVDTIIGDIGANVLYGNNGNDIINGGDGADILNGGNDNDTLNGGAGDDNLYGGAGADIIDGGAGWNDNVYYTDSTAAVSINLATGINTGGYAEGDVLSNVEVIRGSGYNDTLVGDDRNNTLVGNGGNDTIIAGAGDDTWLEGGAGADTIDGGDGNDKAVYKYSNAAVTIDLTLGTGFGGTAAGDRFINVENISGSDFNDTIKGNAVANILEGGLGNDSLYGYGGNDTLSGNEGNDTIRGGLGADILTGGAGNDNFNYDNLTDSKNGSYDTIQDFTLGQDHIDLTALNTFGIDSFTDLAVTYSATETIIKANDSAHPGATDSFELHLKGIIDLHDTDFVWGT